MNTFQRTTANIAAWNLEGKAGIPDERIKEQVEGLTMLDAEVVALVEINPIEALDKIRAGLLAKGVTYHSSLLRNRKTAHRCPLQGWRRGVKSTVC